MESFTSLTTDNMTSVNGTTYMTSTLSVDITDNSSVPANYTTLQDDVRDPQLSTAFMAIYFSIRLIFSGLAIFSNMLTIVAVIRFEQLQNTTNFWICSLAAGDMLGGCLTPLVITHQTLSDQPIFVPLCLVEKNISLISTSINLLSIMCIAVDRYIYIAHPLHYPHWVTRKKTFIVIGLTWLFFITQITLIFMFTHHLKIGMTCKFSVFLSDLAYNRILLPQIAVYAATTVMFYIAIGQIAYKQGRAIAALNQPYDTYEAAMNRQQKKIAKMMVTVLGTYFICYTPQVIISIILRQNRTITWLGIEKITVIIYWANTWLNPLIYAWKSEAFRVAFRKLLGLKPTNTVGAVPPP